MTFSGNTPLCFFRNRRNCCFRFRRVVYLGSSASVRKLNPRQVVLLKRAANSNDVIGHLRVRGDEVQLIVGANNRASAERLIEGVAKRMGATVGEERRWKGILSMGFEVPEELIKRTEQ